MDHVSPTSRKAFNHESVMSQGIIGTVSTVLMQCSPDIGKVCLDVQWGMRSGGEGEGEVLRKLVLCIVSMFAVLLAVTPVVCTCTLYLKGQPQPCAPLPF